MDYFLDLKFCPISETLLTMAIIREDNVAMYVGVEGSLDKIQDDWVKQNVVELIDKAPIRCHWSNVKEIQQKMVKFFDGDKRPNFVAGWPEHLIYFHKLIVPEPGRMIVMEPYTIDMRRTNGYPTEVHTAVRHNAFWDAMVLKQKVQFPNGMGQQDLLKIQEELLTFNPVTGEDFPQDVLTGVTMRQHNPEVPWYYNPWTGKMRDPEAMQADPFGAKIKYGD